jgi:hypothetical protein
MINPVPPLGTSESSNQHKSYLENIIARKVSGAALSCFESFVHCFLTTFSCLYPSYQRLYQAEIAKLSTNNLEPNLPRPPSPLDLIDPPLEIRMAEDLPAAEVVPAPHRIDSIDIPFENGPKKWGKLYDHTRNQIAATRKNERKYVGGARKNNIRNNLCT